MKFNFNNIYNIYNIFYYYIENLLPITGYILLSFILFNYSCILFKTGTKFINWYLNSIKKNELIEETNNDNNINEKIIKKMKYITIELKKINNRLLNIEKIINQKYELSDTSDDENDKIINNKTGIFNNFFLTQYNETQYLLKPFELSSSIKNIQIGYEWNNELNGWIIKEENIKIYIDQGAILMKKIEDIDDNNKEDDNNNILLSELSDNATINKCLNNVELSDSDSDIDINKMINKDIEKTTDK
jgi:hypothetical protein